MTSQNPPLKLFRAGELADLTGVSTDTLRYYERKGVLPHPERTTGVYRQYPSEAIARVRLIQRALAIGFTLDELATILCAKDRGRVPFQEVRLLAGEKLAALEDRLRELAQLRDALQATLSVWDERLEHTPAGEQAHLLEGLEATMIKDGREPSSARKEFPNERSRDRMCGPRNRESGSRNG